jgi:hypothetical protein
VEIDSYGRIYGIEELAYIDPFEAGDNEKCPHINIIC